MGVCGYISLFLQMTKILQTKKCYASQYIDFENGWLAVGCNDDKNNNYIIITCS